MHFDFDIISSAHGIHLLDRFLAVLSLQHQTIHLFQIDRNTGAFITIVKIGRTIFDDDLMYFSDSTEVAVAERCFMGLKIKKKKSLIFNFLGFRQRFLSYLYRQNFEPEKRKAFLRNISYYRLLKMHKIQFLGPELILIRMETNSKKKCLFTLFYAFFF